MAGGMALEHVRCSDEIGNEQARRPIVNLLRRPHLNNTAAIHHRYPVGHRHGFVLVVRDIDEGDANLALDARELRLHLLTELEIERAQRLVKQQH